MCPLHQYCRCRAELVLCPRQILARSSLLHYQLEGFPVQNPCISFFFFFKWLVHLIRRRNHACRFHPFLPNFLNYHVDSSIESTDKYSKLGTRRHGCQPGSESNQVLPKIFLYSISGKSLEINLFLWLWISLPYHRYLHIKLPEQHINI